MTFDIIYTGCTRKTRIIDVVYNASNNELVRTKTLVKNCIVLVDSLPYRQWYEAHYASPLGRKKGAKLVCGGNTNVLYTYFHLVGIRHSCGTAIITNVLKC